MLVLPRQVLPKTFHYVEGKKEGNVNTSWDDLAGAMCSVRSQG